MMLKSDRINAGFPGTNSPANWRFSGQNFPQVPLINASAPPSSFIPAWTIRNNQNISHGGYGN